MSSTDDKTASKTSNKFAMENRVEEHGLGDVIAVNREEIVEAAKSLKEAGFNLFLFVSGIDYEDEIRLTYRITAVNNGETKSVFIKSLVPKEDPVIDSVVPVWPSASWHEREMFDLYGVEFRGHHNLKRIFMPDDWVGHPLRKDYSDDHMIIFPEFLKDKEKQKEKKEKKAVAASKEESDSGRS